MTAILKIVLSVLPPTKFLVNFFKRQVHNYTHESSNFVEAWYDFGLQYMHYILMVHINRIAILFLYCNYTNIVLICSRYVEKQYYLLLEVFCKHRVEIIAFID